MSNIDTGSDRIEKAQAEPEMGDLLVAYLNQLGVEYVFGVPGGAIEPLYNALARSERRGGARVVVARHETGMEAEIAGRLEMERELRQAIERDELVLFYQPKIDFKTGALTGAEALVRWDHPEEGVIAPNVFIPLA